MSLYCGHLRSRFAHLYGLSGSIPVNVTITTLGWYHKNFSIGQIKCILLVQLQHWQWTYIFIDQIHVITLEIKNTILEEGLGFFLGPLLLLIISIWQCEQKSEVRLWVNVAVKIEIAWTKKTETNCKKKEKILRDHFSQNKLQKTSAADSVQKTLDNWLSLIELINKLLLLVHVYFQFKRA